MMVFTKAQAVQLSLEAFELQVYINSGSNDTLDFTRAPLEIPQDLWVNKMFSNNSTTCVVGKGTQCRIYKV